METINTQGKILLALLPFWDPQIPPLGIACLTSYLKQHGFKNVRAVDANINVEFREIHDRYFNFLQAHVPADKIGNLYNIGNQVFRNHLMACLNYEDEEQYVELVKILVAKTFFCEFDEKKISLINDIVEDFYARLEGYVMDLLEQENPAVLGLSVYGDTFPASLFAFKLAKEKCPGIKTVMGGGIFADQLAPGGPDLDFFIEKTKDYIDKIIIGESEELFLKLVKNMLDGSQKVYGLKDLEGINLDMASVDIPDFTDFNIQYYPYLAHYGSRSCPFQCRFCSETINWGNYRKKPIANVVDELKRLYHKYNCQLFLLTDSLLNPIVADLANEVIKSGVPIYWDGFLRADKPVCDPGNTLLWRRGGFYRAKLGIESGSPDVLRLMGKKITIRQIEEALYSLSFAGIKTTTFWLFGYPGETEEDFQQTLDLLERLKDNIYEADCNPFNYYLTGQANSEEWLKNNKGVLLYPPWAADMLITPTRVLNSPPSREEAFSRVNRFMGHIKKLGIPNPYSLKDICQADQRWNRLHKNAVPSLVDLKNRDIVIDESKEVKEMAFAQTVIKDDEDDWFCHVTA